MGEDFAGSEVSSAPQGPIFEIKNEGLATRCEVCHNVDCFDPSTNSCIRCSGLPAPSESVAPITENAKVQMGLSVEQRRENTYNNIVKAWRQAQVSTGSSMPVDWLWNESAALAALRSVRDAADTYDKYYGAKRARAIRILKQQYLVHFILLPCIYFVWMLELGSFLKYFAPFLGSVALFIIGLFVNPWIFVVAYGIFNIYGLFSFMSNDDEYRKYEYFVNAADVVLNDKPENQSVFIRYAMMHMDEK